MTFWDWFQKYGDRVFTFFSIASLAVSGLTDVSPAIAHGAVVVGVLATAAHQSFIPTPTLPVKPAQEK